MKSAGNLLKAGATKAFPEAIESSLLLGGNALSMAGVLTDDVDQLLHDVRKSDYDLVQMPDENDESKHQKH